MKITFIVPNIFAINGGNRIISGYAKRLKRRGHDVLVISPPQKKKKLIAQVRAVLRRDWAVLFTKKVPSFYEVEGVNYRVTKHYSVADEDVPDADIVIATWWETAEWVAGFSPQKGRKIYLVQHHEIFDSIRADEEAIKNTYRLPFHKIVVAKWLLKVMRDQYGDRNVALVPNTLDFEIFNAPPRLKQKIPTIGMMHSHVHWKGSDLGIKAYLEARKVLPPLRFVVFGRKNRPSTMPREAEYFCSPAQNDLKNIYSRCDAWLFTSTTEGFGLPILEAMACRTPVVATPTGAAPELLAGGGGILVKPNDPYDMAKAIVKICSLSEDEWRAMSDVAYARATSYTWEDAVTLFEAELYSVLKTTCPKER